MNSFLTNAEISLRKLLWQFSAFLLACVLLVGMHHFFNHLIDKLDEQTKNERARLFIGELIIQGIRNIESDVYRMATTIGARGQRVVYRDIEHQMAKLMTILNVLEVGGSVSQQLRLNLVDNDRMIREVEFQPDRQEGEYVLEIIDLHPKIDTVFEHIRHLEGLLKQRESAREAGHKQTRMQLIDQIKHAMKGFAPMFTRLEENANRLFYESHQRLDQLQVDITHQERLYLILESGMVVLIIVSVMLFGYVSATQIAGSNQQLRLAKDDMQRAKDQAEQASMAKTEFLSRMSHELRTPLNAILGFNQLIAYDKRISDEQRDHVGKIEQAGQHLLQLINEVLDLSRIEHGALQLNSDEVDLKRLVEESFSLLKSLAEDKKIRMIHHLNPTAPLVKADYTRLKQVLINLLSNALKYNLDAGEVELFTRVRDNCLYVCIRDTGMGIDPARFPELFKPFSRLDADRFEVEGTGIGLALSKQLVEHMGGEIGVDSTPGVGSLFWFSLELLGEVTDSAAHEPQLHTGPKSFELSQGRGHQPGGVLILVAEDNLTNQELIGKQLHLLGYQAELVNNGKEALDRICSGGVDLLLTDCNMPVMDGYQLSETLRGNEKSGSTHLPVIAITANALADDVNRCYAAGIDDYMAKPVSLEVLQDKLAQWLPQQVSPPKSKPTASSAWSGATQSEVLNPSVLEALVGPNRSTQLRILKKFQDATPQDVAVLQQACAAGVLDGIAGAAHKIKSAANSVGAIGLGRLCETLEDAARKGVRDVIEELSPGLSAQMKEVDAAIAGVIDDLQGSPSTENAIEGYRRRKPH